MSRSTRYLLHMLIMGVYWYLIFNGSHLSNFEEKNRDLLVLTFILVNWFFQYLLLSSLLKFQFWGRFFASTIFWGVSFYGSIFLTMFISFEIFGFNLFSKVHHDTTLVEIFGFIIYCIVTVVFYESLSSPSTLKDGRMIKFIKRILKKTIDPHNQGIQ